MTTSAEIVEKIKRILSDPEGATQGNLTKLAAEYAALCRRLNANVERAVAMLRSGALSESERILEEYSVLEEFQRLCFDEKEDWRAVCRTLGLEVAILPHEQAFEELRSFVDVYERTRNLFAKERRLALEGGSSAQRLQNLYALESIFPQYDIWKVPIKDLEQQRVVEISSRLKETTKQNVDFAFVTSALEELEAPKRRSRAPEELVNSLRAWKEYVEKTESLKRLKALLEEWKKARESNDDLQELACLQYFRDKDLSKATKLADQDEVKLLNELTRRAEIIERRERARVQLKRKTRELSRALETDSNADRLADLFASTELESDKAGEALDPSITRAYRRRMETLETQQRRRRFAFILFLSLTALLFGAATTHVIKRAQTKRNVDEAVGIITSKLQDYERINERVEALDEAEKIVKNYEETQPKLLRVPEYMQAVDRVKNTRAQEAQRRREFKDVVAKISNAHKQNDPSSFLDNLKGRCRTEQERTDYLKLEKKNQELIAQAKEAKANAYSQKLKELIDAEEALEEAQNLTENEVKREISKITQGIYELKWSENGQEPPEIKNLTAKLEKFENRFKRASQIEEEISAHKETQNSDSPLESEPVVEPSVVPDSNEADENDAFNEALRTLEP